MATKITLKIRALVEIELTVEGDPEDRPTVRCPTPSTEKLARDWEAKLRAALECVS
jgi:hypothetical protein